LYRRYKEDVAAQLTEDTSKALQLVFDRRYKEDVAAMFYLRAGRTWGA